MAGMKQKPDPQDKKKKIEGMRYLRKFEIVETDVQLPIQGQVRDPDDLYQFMKDLESEAVPKVIAVYMDQDHLFLGHQVFLGTSSGEFNPSHLWHYYYLFLARKFILIVNHPGSGDASPSDADMQLIQTLQVQSQTLADVYFADFVIVSKGHYFSMAFNEGTACRCGHQEYMD